MSNYSERNSESGISLIKVTGIIVIVSLILSGVALLTSINNEYHLRQVAFNVNRMKYSILSFKNIYGALPGDISNASFHWKNLTKDGDGDGQIFHINGEGLLVWQHLKLANLLELQDSLTPEWKDGQKTQAIIGYNVPSSHIKGAGYYVDFAEDFGGNFLGFGSEAPNSVNNGPALTPNEMMRLDIMIDDGLPNSGSILAFAKADDECFVTGEYKISTREKECSAIFKF